MIAARQALRQLRQELRLTERRERSDRALRFFRDAGAAGFHAVQPDEGVLVLVHTGRFAELRGIADHIQNIILNLEGQPETCSVIRRCLLLGRAAAGCDNAELAGSRDERARFARLDGEDLLLRADAVLGQTKIVCRKCGEIFLRRT